MIPGFGGDALGKAGEEESARRLTRCITMMKSMADSGTLSSLSVACVVWTMLLRSRVVVLRVPYLQRAELDNANAGKLFRMQPSRTTRVAKGDFVLLLICAA